MSRENATSQVQSDTQHDAQPAVVAAAEGKGGPAWGRRGMLAASAAAVAAFAAACSSNSQTSSGSSSTAAAAGGGAAGDLAVAKLAAGLEVLAVGTYKAALDAATAGKLGAVPPAVATFVQTAMGQHQEHLDAWNTVLTGAGQPKVTEPDAKLKPTVDAAFAKVSDVGGAANLALMLEQIAAQTYSKAIPTLQSKDAIKLAGQIQIIDQQHQAILLYALGMYPVPEVFQSTAKAAS
ncbi:MAG: ferritin-like domain-containing protein [Pseudonocardiaceae bacterium]